MAASVTFWFREHLSASTGWPAVWGLSAAASALLFVSVLLHELSHSFVALAKGLPVPRITLFIFGGVSQLGEEPRRPVDEILIALAGPVASFFIATVCFGLIFVLFKDPSLQPPLGPGLALLIYLCAINIMLGLFNLVPAYPLDGGRVLRALIWLLHGSMHRATVVAARLGRLMAFGLMAMGALVVLLTGTLTGLWWVVIGFFLNHTAGASARRAALREALTGTPVHRIMSQPVATVAPAQTLAAAVSDAFLRHHFVSYPVTDADVVHGVLTLKDVKKFPREEWPWRTAAEAMTPLPKTEMAAPEEDVVDVLERMLRTGHGRMPVASDGRLVSVLTRRDIMNFLRIQTDLGTGRRE